MVNSVPLCVPAQPAGSAGLGEVAAAATSTTSSKDEFSFSACLQLLEDTFSTAFSQVFPRTRLFLHWTPISTWGLSLLTKASGEAFFSGQHNFPRAFVTSITFSATTSRRAPGHPYALATMYALCYIQIQATSLPASTTLCHLGTFQAAKSGCAQRSTASQPNIRPLRIPRHRSTRQVHNCLVRRWIPGSGPLPSPARHCIARYRGREIGG